MSSDHRALVTFRDVCKTYDGATQVIEHLDLDIYKGEFLSLLGPSGSGKTTCLMMLAGFESPTSGEIRLDDRLLNTTPPHRRDIGMVFQNYALFPHMNVAQNVGYALTVRRVSKAEKREAVQRALAMVRMEEFSDRMPMKLSGGQQQRVALARALVFNPRLVLMDEPLGALDKRLREHMQIELKELHRQLGLTFVYVTHDQSEALTMSDRVAVFDGGRIQQIDKVDYLYETPANSTVANFVGDNNVFSGEVTRIDGAACEIVLPGGVLLRGRAGVDLTVGQAVQGCVRPERMELLGEQGATQACANVIRVRSEGVIYFGDHVRLRFSLQGQSKGFVKIPLGNRHLSLCGIGREVFIGLSEEHLRIFS